MTGALPARVDKVSKASAKDAPPALHEVTLEVRPGAITGLVGPDGAGKTTLIRMLAGLLQPTRGAVTVLGAAAGAKSEDVGYMPQRFGLYEDVSVLQNLTLFAKLRGLPEPEHEAVFKRLLTFTDLARFQDRLAGKLSGGMKQKLGLACAMVRSPKLLLLDEPTVGVDPLSRRELWKMVETLVHEGIGVLWSTAYLDEAERCGEVYLLNEGKMLFSGPPGDLTDRMQGRSFKLGNIVGNRRDPVARPGPGGHQRRPLGRQCCPAGPAS
jgi:ABC-2 type transport system ATP-binding protein